jgi:drug/metabolite transporter (DMT)-like permease
VNPITWFFSKLLGTYLSERYPRATNWFAVIMCLWVGAYVVLNPGPRMTWSRWIGLFLLLGGLFCYSIWQLWKSRKGGAGRQ